MKKIKVFLAALAIIALLLVYFFIPNQITISSSIKIPQNANATIRSFTNMESWENWMPTHSKQGNSFQLSEGTLTLKPVLIAAIKTNYAIGENNLTVNFSAIDYKVDSAFIYFEGFKENNSLNPLKRVINYLFAVKAKEQLLPILKAASNYYSKNETIYGFEIIETKVKDTTLITTEQTYPDTPTTAQVYAMIQLLEKHIKNNKGVIHGDPMVNITRLGKNEVYAQVAFPLAADIPTAKNIVVKKMVLGNILAVKVKGTAQTVQEAFTATELYMHDRKKTSPAIPFISYNTNRIIEKNANNWVSTIYYPIF